MVRFRNIRGYIMKGDLPIVRFAYEGGMLTVAEVIAGKEDLPIEYKGKVDARRATELFLSDRVVPETRQFLQEELAKVGIEYYDPDAMLRHNKGVSIEDDYWLQLEE